jgi:hypothetical protein
MFKDNVSVLLSETTCLQKLFKYIGGENEGKKSIPMTAPVRVSVQPSSGPFCANDFTISFFVPYEFQVRLLHMHPEEPCQSREACNWAQGVKQQLHQSYTRDLTQTP